jgi:hypothetical protein
MYVELNKEAFDAENADEGNEERRMTWRQSELFSICKPK